MWSWFGGNKRQDKLIKLEKYIDGFVTANGIDFTGQAVESSNGRFLVAWSDRDSSSGRGGHRESGFGTYVIAEDGIILAIGRAERPNDGKVANNGTFILNDWMLGEGLRGTFLAFDKSNCNIIRQLFSANLYSNGISENGEYGACQLCYSGTEDGGVLAFFDLARGHLLWKMAPETGRADGYRFDTENRVLTLCYKDKQQFDYSFDGVLLDTAKWKKVEFQRANGFQLHSRAKEQRARAQEAGDSEGLRGALELLNIALKRGIDQYPNEQAAICREMGEINEVLGDSGEALRQYERAIRLNPKVGLKRKIAAMKSGDSQ